MAARRRTGLAYTQIRLEIDEGLAVLTLARPERLNAWSDAMEAEIQDALRESARDDAVRCVVVTGEGRAFCAGADLAAGGGAFRDRPAESSTDAIYPWDVPKPVIAAINGHAVGVGITFAMSCDVRFVADDAKIAFAFVRRGVLPGFASHLTVARAAGAAAAAELLLSGRTILGQEAASLGLATRALPAADVLPAALDLARDIARHTAPVAVALCKRLLWEAPAWSPAQLKAREDRWFAWLGNQPDAREGIEAFLHKRDPRWSMRVSRDLPPALD
jgi:enoyl-CoA hydratase/carnithine racemase